MDRFISELPVEQITKDGKSHYGGYYDKCPWNESGKFILGLELSKADLEQQIHDPFTIGIVDIGSRTWSPITTTHAWSWQLGPRQFWLPGSMKIIYNTVTNSKYAAVVHNLENNHKDLLPMPIYDVSNDGKTAFTLNFARLAAMRSGYGYEYLGVFHDHKPLPDDDGIWKIDLNTKATQLLISYRQIAFFDPHESMKNVNHWFNHIAVSPTGKRVFFLHRWEDFSTGSRWWKTRLITMNADGTDIYALKGLERVSHYDWYDDESILLTAHPAGDNICRHLLIKDKNSSFSVLSPDFLNDNGHCSWSPNREWIITDTYPGDDGYAKLLLLRFADQKCFEIASIYSPPEFRGSVRCDLHPRWDRTGTKICIDSVVSNKRQMYIIDISKIINE